MEQIAFVIEAGVWNVSNLKKIIFIYLTGVAYRNSNDHNNRNNDKYM